MPKTDLNIPIWLHETKGFKRRYEPVRIGVPVCRGLLHDSDDIALIDSEQQFIPVQARSLALWPDRSIKWLLLDFFADSEPNCKQQYFLIDKVSAEKISDNHEFNVVCFTDQSSHFSISTGNIQYEIHKNNSSLLSGVFLGKTRVSSQNTLQVNLKDSKERLLTLQVENYIVEESGPLRATFTAEGFFSVNQKKSPVAFKSRITFFAELSAVKVEFTIINTHAAAHPGGLWDLGDPGSFLFNELSINIIPNSASQGLSWKDQEAGDWHVFEGDGWFLYQDSSGGDQWNSPNHVDHSGSSSVSFKGYRVFDASQLSQRQQIADGMRANPIVRLETEAGWLAVCMPHFWQNFPKGLRWQNDHLSIGLFPGESRNSFELQGGEQKRHTFWLVFGTPTQEMVIPGLLNPIQISIDPEWIERTKAVPYFSPQQSDKNQDYIAYISNIIEGPNSFFSKRELIDEYGWRNFGDLYADHEAVNHTGTRPFVSHYNNQYDFIYGALVHFLRSSDWRWFQLMDAAAQHTIDIDIYHTDQDKSAYNHGLFWHTDHYHHTHTCTHRTYSRQNRGNGNYGGGPSNEHNYTSGLLYYFYLTGDPEAASAVIELANWVISMDEGSHTLLGIIDSGPTGDASKTTSADYHKAGRGAGNSINALLDAYALSNDRHYFDKAEALIQRCIHPTDDIDALKLDEPEYRWSYLVFLQVLGKYLNTKLELGEIDYYFITHVTTCFTMPMDTD
ncbi:MAG: hypothetical protein R3F53_13290 [Gammaproteobacteria bacterium]